MSTYLVGLVAVSALIGVSSYVSYDQRWNRTLRFTSSLVLLCAVIAPFISFLRDAEFSLSEIEKETEIRIEDSELSEGAEKAFCDGVRRYICESFSLSEGEVEVKSYGFDLVTVKAEKIKVILYGSAVFSDSRAIAERVESAGLGECEVNIGVK